MISDPDVVGLLYLVTIACFVVSLKFLSSPRHARKGNWIGGAGMLLAIATTLLLEGLENWLLDRGRTRDRQRRRLDRRAQRPHDRDAADGGDLQRRRWRRSGSGRALRMAQRR